MGVGVSGACCHSCMISAGDRLLDISVVGRVSGDRDLLREGRGVMFSWLCT